MSSFKENLLSCLITNLLIVLENESNGLFRNAYLSLLESAWDERKKLRQL